MCGSRADASKTPEYREHLKKVESGKRKQIPNSELRRSPKFQGPKPAWERFGFGAIIEREDGMTNIRRSVKDE
jgi:hypothetical protein